jgi:hypothetical protein
MAKVIIDEHDIEIGQYILTILKTRLDIVTSWGLDPETLRPIKYGIQFHVQGFKHNGLVRVTLNEGADLFEVCLISDNGEMTDSRESIFLEDLISTIDELVEKTDDYEKRISEEYPFLTEPDNPEKVRHIEIIIL